MTLDPAARARLLTPPAPGSVVDVVVDTDATNEIDDQYAIAWALRRSDRLRVLALTAAPYAIDPTLVDAPGLLDDLGREHYRSGITRWLAGRPRTAADGVARAAAECRRLVALCGTDTPVLDGAPRVLPDEVTPVPSDAAEALVALSREDREVPLHVLAIGAVTNVASALLLDPTLADRVVVVWTSAYPSWWRRPNASFNLVQDLAAARVLLGSGVPLVYVPGYLVGEQLRTTLPELRAHLRGPVGSDLLRMTEESPFLDDTPGSSWVCWDLACVAYALDATWLTTDLVATPGLDAELRWQDEPGRPLMREAFRIDRDAVYRDLFRSLQD